MAAGSSPCLPLVFLAWPVGDVLAPRPRTVRRSTCSRKPVDAAHRLVHALAGRASAPALTLAARDADRLRAAPVPPARAGELAARRWSPCRSCCRPSSSGTAFRARAAGDRGSGPSRRSSWRTCSSTSPSWCASSAACGRTWTRGTSQAARTLGATPWYAFRTVTWPLVRPAVLAASALVFLLHLHVLRRGARARRPGDRDPRGRDLPPYRPAARPARCGRDRRRAAARCSVRCSCVSAGCRPGSPYGNVPAPAEEVLGPVRGRRLVRWWASSSSRSCSSPSRCSRWSTESFRVGDRWGLAWWRELFAAPVTTRDVDVAPRMRTSARLRGCHRGDRGRRRWSRRVRRRLRPTARRRGSRPG